MECEYCDRKFKYRKSFVNHMQIEHGISDADSDTEKEKEIKDITNIDIEQTNTNVINNAETGDKTEGKQPMQFTSLLHVYVLIIIFLT